MVSMETPPPPPAPDLPPPGRPGERLPAQAEPRRFATAEVLPLANRLDPVKGEMPRSFLDRMGEQGYFGIMIRGESGGMGLGVFEYCLIAEELARAWMSVASIIARGQGMGTQYGDSANRRERLERSARGQWIGAAAFSEPGAGSDLASVATRAVRHGDEWVITGEKRWTGFALEADFLQVLCRISDPEPGESRSRGLASIVVEKERGRFPPGIDGRPLDKIGYHGFTTWNLTLDGVRVPAANLLGADPSSGPESRSGSGFRALERQLNVARVHTAARAVGLARAALEDCVLYVQERVQVGRPIGGLQAGRFQIAPQAAP